MGVAEELFPLPRGWVWSTIQSVTLDAQSGFASGKKNVPNGIKHLRMNNISADCNLDTSSVITVPTELARQAYLLKFGDILFCHTNSVKLVGKTALFDRTDGPYAFSNHLTRLRIGRIGPLPEWLWYWLSWLWRRRYFETRCKQWVNQAAVERKTLLASPIPVAPLEEQRRIVERVKELKKRNRIARDTLDGLHDLVRRFGESVLARAFRGELSDRDPNDEPAADLLKRVSLESKVRDDEEPLRSVRKGSKESTHDESKRPEIEGLYELPDSWAWTTIGTIETFIGSGITPLGGQNVYVSEGIPFIRSQNVYPDGLRLEDVVHVTPNMHAEMKRTHIRPGDVLLNITGASIGRSASVPNGFGEANVNQHVCIIRTGGQITPSFLSNFLNSTEGQDQIFATESGVTREGLNFSQIRGLRIPIAPMGEQKRIVKKIDELLTRVKMVENAAESAKSQTELLEQSIIDRAFHGKLCAQNPSDESAAVLLSTIEGERKALEKKPHGTQLEIVSTMRTRSSH